MGKDYYKILGVERNASAEDIKRAFRILAHKYHPDKAGGDEAKFKEINEAYQVLGNEQKRKQYDQFGSTFEQQGGFGNGVSWDDFMRQARSGDFQRMNFDFGNVDLGDIFSDLFGFGDNRKKSRSRTRGADLQIDLKISLREAFTGIKKTLEFEKNVKCSSCHGNGAEPGTRIMTCKTCGGSGVVTQVQNTFIGTFQTQVVCPDCRGEGKFAEVKCKKCSGRGVRREKVSVDIEIPAGIEDGQSLQLVGYGEAGENGGQNGDLYVLVKIKNDSGFKRDGADLYSKVKIKYSQAVLGDKIEVETIDGFVRLTIPEGTQPGDVFKLRGKGMPKTRGFGRGDHYVEVTLDVPKHLNKEQKRLIKELSENQL